MRGKMNKVVHIRLSDYCGNSIHTRSAVRRLWADLSCTFEKETVFVVQIDFKSIDFVSRNAMHELILLERKLASRSTSIVFENMNQQVQSMYDLVVSSKDLTKRSIIVRHNISSVNEFSSLLAV